MVDATPLLPQWNAGELSPRLAARTDFDLYQNGAEILENMIPLTEGGCMRRAGTRYVATAKSGTDDTRLTRFQFSTTQSYVIEYGDQYFRFYRNQGQIVAGATDASVTNGNFASDITGWTSLSTGGGSISWSSSDLSMALTITSSSDVAGAFQNLTVSSSVVANEHIMKFIVGGRPGEKATVRVGVSSSDSGSIFSAKTKDVGYHAIPFTPNSTQLSLHFLYDGTLLSGISSSQGSPEINIGSVSIIDNEVFELQTPWGSSEVPDLHGPQSADVKYFYHNNLPTYKLQRFGHTEWGAARVAWQDGPWLSTNTTLTTLTPAATTGTVTVTASATTGINDDAGFSVDDVFRSIRISNPSTSTDNWGWGIITGFTSTTVVTVEVKRDFPAASATTEWRLGAFSTKTGWPGTGTFHQQRLVSARTTEQPQTLFFSQSGDFENMSPDSPSSSEWEGTIEADDALNFTISSDNVEPIEWLSAGQTLQIGTRAAEWQAESQGAALTATDFAFNKETNYGSARVQPVRVGHATVFLQRDRRHVRELIFDFDVDGLLGGDLTRLASHVTVGGVSELAYQQSPDSILWGVRGDGQLLSMTYRREEQVAAWSRHIMGGAYTTGIAQAKSVTTIPGSTASGQTQDSEDRDEVWALVKRTINGSTVQYVEFFERDYEDGDSQEDSYYADSLLTYDSTAATSLTGASHIAAATAKVLANGALHPDVTIGSSGGFTLDFESSTVQVGLGYTHRLKTFKLDHGGVAGTALTHTKRITDVTAILHNSHVLNIGQSSSQLDTFDFREVADAMDTAVPFVSDEKFVEMEHDWQTDPRIYIEGNEPTPFTLLGLVPGISTQDRK